MRPLSRHATRSSRSPRVVMAPAALALATLVAAAPVHAQDDVAGTWIISLASPDGTGTVEVPVVFEQDGAEVTGVMDLSAIPEVVRGRIDEGAFVDGVLSFLLHIDVQGQIFTAEVEADVQGDEMAGEVYLAEMGLTSPFTARREG